MSKEKCRICREVPCKDTLFYEQIGETNKEYAIVCINCARRIAEVLPELEMQIKIKEAKK